MKARLFWIIAGLLVIGAVVTFFVVRPQLAQLRSANGGPAGQALETAEVRTMQALTTVEASGAVEPQQQASLAWNSTGTIATVEVSVGANVAAGDVLMTIDPATAATNFIQAQSDLIAAQNDLEDLQNPTELDIANAEKAIADAEDTLETLQKELRGLMNPDVAYYADQVADKERVLLTA